MLRLIQIEWLKTKSSSSFWFLLILFGIGVYVVCSIGTVLMNANIESYSSHGPPPELPSFNIYEFPDIWHNLTYLASVLKVFLGIIIIVSVCNEFAYRTLKQNIIDGLNPLEFIGTKLVIIVALAFLSMIWVTGLVYYFGLNYAETDTWGYMYRKIDFIGAYFIQALMFMCMSMMIALLLRTTGLAIVFMLAYSLFLETIIRWMFFDTDGMLVRLLPVEANNSLIQLPYNPFNPESTQVSVSAFTVGLNLAWTALFVSLSYLILKRKDL